MQAIQQWLLSVLAASLLTGAARAIMPRGAVSQVGKLACGLVLFLAVVSPVLGARYLELNELLDEYAREVALVEEETAKVSKNLTSSFIDRETDAYIQGKTEELGLSCEVEVLWDWSGEVPVPSEAVVTGELTGDERETLTQTLAQDLTIPAEAITYEEGAMP